MRRCLFIVFCVLIFSIKSIAQAPQSWTAGEMYQAIKKLNVLGSVLYIAAHPDDENTRLIAYLSKDKLYRTGYLSLTRGDGGQNLIGDEQGVDLGLIRTQELLAARRLDGGEQFFSRAFDFGYSKNPEETFSKWDKEKILSDVVWVIRKFQPDIIITRFPTTGEGGHGHHTASAILANEAFAAAADPTRFPEQFKYGAQPWQVKRILWNTFNFGGNNTTKEDQFKLDVGGYNSLLGESYGEIAAESRSQHKSQGFGVPASRGEAIEYFSTTKGNTPKSSLLDDINISWSRIEGGNAIEQSVDSILKNFDFLHPENSVKDLVGIYQKILALSESIWKNIKLNEVKMLIAQCSGLFIEVVTNSQYAVQTDSIKINFNVNNRLGADAVLTKINLDSFDSTLTVSLGKNKNIGFSKTFFIPNTKSLTQPYWLTEPKSEGYFNVSDQQKIGQPNVDPAYLANVQIKFYNSPLDFSIPVQYKFTDPVKGELYEPVVVIPTVLLSLDSKLKITRGNNNFKGTIYLTPQKDSIAVYFGKLYNKEISKFSYQYIPKQLLLTQKSKKYQVGYAIHANEDNQYYMGTQREDVALMITDLKTPFLYYQELHTIKYDHIPYINYLTNISAVNRKLDLKIVGKKIGYITGAGDKVPQALELMGYQVTILDEKELERNNLSQFDAIITGVRTYNTHDWMNTYYDKLMKYVNDGGNLIVQYNTSNQIGPVRAKIGPYNFDITRNRVTDENAKVILLKPASPVFNFPNKITEKDFDGWIQERSIYHASDPSGKYEKLLGMSDPGEKSDDGSLIVTKYGKGWFTYTGLVFFRELPAGVPGAYRLFANLIALNQK